MSVLAFIFLSFSASASAPGYKEIDYCISISNIQEYNEYTFLLYEMIMGEYSVLDENACASFSKNSIATFYAIEKSKFNKTELGNTFEKHREYFSNNPDLISSAILIKSYNDVPETSPLISVEDSYAVLSIDSTLELESSVRFFNYADGTTKNETFYTSELRKSPQKDKELDEEDSPISADSQSWPENIELEPPEIKQKTFPYYIIYIAMPIAIIIAIIIFQIKRKKRF